MFPDTGAAALARRDWGETAFLVADLGSRNTPIERKIAEQDQAYLVIAPSAVEVQTVERLCELAGDRPVVLLIPQLEDVAVVGIGYAARQLRERFLSTLEPVYYLRPLEAAVLVRAYPAPWQLWQATPEGRYDLAAEFPQRPGGEAIDRVLMADAARLGDGAEAAPPRRGGFLSELQSFIRALTQ